MNNIVSDIIINPDYKSYIIVTINDVEICSIVPPLILSSLSGNIIGYSIPSDINNQFYIHYLNEEDNFDIFIKEYSLITSNNSNTTDFSKSFTRIFPQMTIDFLIQLKILILNKV